MDEMREGANRDEADQDEYEGDYDVGEAFGDHNIEYWIYDGQRLVPASPDEEERLRDWWAQRRMQSWQVLEQRRARIIARRATWAGINAWLASIETWFPHHVLAGGARSPRDALAAAHGEPQQVRPIGEPRKRGRGILSGWRIPDSCHPK